MRIDLQQLREAVTRCVAVAAIEGLNAGGQERVAFLIGIAAPRLRLLDAVRGLFVRHVDEKDARPQVDRLLKLTAIERTVAVGEIFLNFFLIVGARLDRCGREIEFGR